MNNTRTRLVILLLGTPQVLEGAQGGQDRTTDPYGVFSLGGSDDLDLHARRRESQELLLHTVGDTGEHGGSTRENNVTVQIATNIEIALEDGVVAVGSKRQGKRTSGKKKTLRCLVDTGGFKSEESGLEESFGSTEPDG